MRTEETKDKGEKEKSTGFNCAQPGHGISGMMTKCCAGRDGFPDCLSMMEGMREEMKKQHCMQNEDAAESVKGKK